VRTWIDTEFEKLAQGDEDINHKLLPPYFFRHILAPAPSRELSAGDESAELGDIDLAPSATLVLVPVKGYTDAYTGGAGVGGVGALTGAAGGIVGGAFGLLSSTVGYVGSTIGGFMGFGGQPQRQQGQQGQEQEDRGGGVGGGRRMGTRPTQEPQFDPVLDQQLPPPPPPSSGSGSASGSSGMRIRTLADQRAREQQPQAFYNGNQLSTEPRPDEDGQKRD
jgi:hypothetical protein